MPKKTTKRAVPKGSHRMPNGKIMKGTKHKTTTKKKSAPKRTRGGY